MADRAGLDARPSAGRPDRWAVAVADRRKRNGATIAELAGQEELLELPPAAFPAQLEVQRLVGRSALVAFEGNHYSVSPGLVGRPSR